MIGRRARRSNRSGRARKRGRSLPALALGALLVAACASETPAPTGEERALAVQGLLVRGTAHAEIKEWEAALGLFEQALELAPEEPAVIFGLALAHLRIGDPDRAGDWVARIAEEAPAEVRARAELLRGRLALEAGDAAAEAAAYRRATELDPGEPVYPYALCQVLPRLGGAESEDEIGKLLRRAHELWPANSRLAAELAQWLLERPDPEAHRQGLTLVEALVAASGRPDLEALVARGRGELEAGRTLLLRRVLNLLRPGKRFQLDSAALETRLQVMPYDEPLSAGLRVAAESAFDPPMPTFEAAALLPLPALTAGESVVDVVASNDAVDGVDGADGDREADLTVLTDRTLWFLGRGEPEPRRIAALDGEPRRVLVGELDGDGWMEIVVFAATGVRLFGRSAESGWTERDPGPVLAAADLRHPLLVDFEHDGDLDLLALDDAGRPTLVVHRGEAGWGAPEPAPLPLERARGPLLATDLDGDTDLDLLVARENEVAVLVNWRQGEFRPADPLPVTATVHHLAAFDRDGDGRLDLAATTDAGLRYWRNDRDRGLVAVDPPVGPGPSAIAGTLALGDLDLDGDLDLVVGGERNGEAAAGLFVYPSGVAPAAPTRLASIAGESAAGALILDLDGDRSPDLLTWSRAGLETLRSAGPGEQLWIALGLRGLAGKVPLDGRGALVRVSWGLEERLLAVDRPEVLVGLGRRPPALVKITWPNGISEYLHRPTPGSRHLVEQVLRIEGSCPFLYASDGAGMRFVTDILGLSPLGMLAAPGVYVEPDPEEYLRLPDWVAAADGRYRLSVTEELREVAYLDQLELVAVDAPAGVEVYNGERWIEPPVRGLDLKLLAPLAPPVSVRDDLGRSVGELLAAADHRYLTNHRGRRLYQGAVERHSLVVELPADVAGAPRPALVLFGWLHWGNTSVNVARAQDPAGAPWFPVLEVPDGRGGWRRTAVSVGLPAGKTKPIVVDLTGALDPADPRMRLTTDFEVYWDRIAVSEILPPTTGHRLHALAPDSARLVYGGFSRWYRPAPNGPYLFDYGDRRPVPFRGGPDAGRPIAWREHQGYYTPFGVITERLLRSDDRLVVFGSGEEVRLEFDSSALPAVPEGWRRTLFLHIEGWEKDGDPNVACSQTVGPLPYRAMTRYPCPPDSSHRDVVAPSAGAAGERWVDAGRLERRVHSWLHSTAEGER